MGLNVLMLQATLMQDGAKDDDVRNTPIGVADTTDTGSE